MNTNLIQQLANGEICTELINKEQIPQLKEIFKKAFPEDNFQTRITDSWWSLKNFYLAYVENKEKWTYSHKSSLPIVPIEHFFLKIEDVCVRGSKEYGDEMKQIFLDNGLKNTHWVGKYKVGFYGSIDGRFDFSVNSVIGTELTFQQLKQYFTQSKKETMEKEQKLLGYKLKYPEYKSAAIEIAEEGCYWRKNESFDLGIQEDISIPKLQKAGVLKLWFTPVYEEVPKNKQFQLNCTGGTFSLTVLKEGFLYVPDNKILSVPFLKNIISPTEEKMQGYDFKSIVSHLDMGCKKAVPVEDIQECIDYWEKNFK